MIKRVSRLFALVAFSLAASIGAADDAIDVMCVYYPHWHEYPKGGAMVDAILGSALRPLLDRGVAVVAVGYRYLRDVEQDGGVKPPVQGCIADCEAAVRFVKEHAGDYGIDVSRLTISGGSAGTCSPLDLLSAGNRQAFVRHGHVQF